MSGKLNQPRRWARRHTSARMVRRLRSSLNRALRILGIRHGTLDWRHGGIIDLWGALESEDDFGWLQSGVDKSETGR